MIVAKFTFNPFQENTYVLYDDSKECLILDPGCYDQRERQRLLLFIEQRGLKPVKLLNTHCHIDHIFGNHFIAQRFNLPLEAHPDEQQTIQYSELAAQMYGLSLDPCPPISVFWKEGDTIRFGQSALHVLDTPGHSPASISLYCEEDGFVLAGDVLFYDSIGRTDLPGGNLDTLLANIQTKLLTLPDETVVYAGHGSQTTIGRERRSNPFLI